jgi:lactaldehyde dehydrogenase / glycolaldehyde dehydrogenase
VTLPIESAATRTDLYIDGRWRPAQAGDRRPVINPATEEVVAEAAEGTLADVDAALDSAQRAQPAWESLPAIERARYLHAIAARVRDQLESLARLVVMEQGKTIAEARGEVGGTAEFFDYFAEFARRLEGELLPSDNRDEHVMVMPVPHGVVVGIMPWNYPSVICARKAAPALVTGNTVVLKPHEETPLSALALAAIADEVGLPAGVLNVVTGPGETVGEALVADRRTDHVTMTGSTEVGKRILESAAKRVMPVSLELGGKAPFIVLADADLDLAVRSAVSARFMNCGQVCTCNERTFVHAEVYEQFLDRYLDQVRGIRVGDPFDPATDMGPKVSRVELDKVDAIVRRAVADGATAVIGGGELRGGGYERGFWYAPTVLTDVRPGMEVMEREIFGPVSPVMPFERLDQILELTNSSPYGLSAYLFTRDLSTAMRVARDLEYGELYINKIGPEQLQGYHTGFRESGIGGDDGKHGLEGFMRRKTVYLNYAQQQ